MEISSATDAAAISDAAGARKSLAGNFDTFLTLLTTQLRNQDPLDPLDSNEFTQQLVQFTSVEQQIAANENLEKILAAMQVDQTSTALGFIGKQVDADLAANGLAEDGAATWLYTLPSNAERVVLTIADADGKLVYAGEGEKLAGNHDFTWDGNDNAGNRLPPGLYTLSVAARDGSDGVIETEIAVRGVVDGATTTDDGSAAVLVGGQPIPLSAVTRVVEATAADSETESASEESGDLLESLVSLF
ncbi:MAG: flagellar hook assembly protein FlgD [Alphaproteobacteria bacterium]